MKPFLKWFGWVFVILLSMYQVQAQNDTLCNPNENKKIFGELYFNYGSVANSYSAFNRSNITMGQPLVSVRNMLSQTNQSGFGVYSSFLLPPQPPVLLATQGEFKDRIKISWNVNPLSPAPTGFVIYRDGSYLTDLGEDIRQFLDFNVQAGEYYEYSIVAKNAFGSGSLSKAVGFVNPNGVVSGKIETNSGNPVPGVEVRLTPLTGASMSFDGVDDELCVSYNDKLPTDKFTVSAYVKLGDNNNEAGIIDWGSTLKKNWWITTTNSSEGKGYIFHIGNGTGSDSLKYIIPKEVTNPELPNQWHQITMVYNGNALSVMVDGNFIGTKPATISRVKNYLNIGSKIGTDGFFRGKIDDIRVYNRPLTQTEVRATKNRSVSKTETGLVAYWKMDEGIGEKVFDNSAVPTNANIYGGAKFSTDIPDVYNAGVSDVTGYYVIDGINYSGTESFRATPMKNFDFNSAIEFNAADKSYGNLTNYDIPDTATVEVLFHPFDLKSRQTILSKGSLFELYVDNSKLYLNLNGNVSDLGTIKAKYYHVAVALDNTHGTAKVYVEGELKTTVSFTGTSNWATGNPWLIATNSTDAATGKFYTGLIDEVAIYKTALPQYEIQRHFVVGIPQDSTTALLYSYFDLNEGSDTKVYDYAAINFGATLPREGILTNASWSNNVRRSESKPHEFEPNVRVVNINTSNTAIGSIDFKDVSTVNVSGYVRFANTFCFEDSVEIKVNGQSNYPRIMTDKTGKWSGDFEPGKTIKLTAEYKDHLFGPSFFEIRKIQAPKAGIVFLDNTKRIIRGQVAGNELCRKSVIPTGARVVVKVATLDGCFEKTDTLRNPDGKFIFKDLPARAFRVSVVEHSNSIIYNYFQGKGGQQVDLRSAVADTVDFIYVAPPKVEIKGIQPNVCDLKTVGQSVENKIKIKVFERYDGGVCYLNGAKFTIDDPSTGTVTDTTLAKDISELVYKFKPKNVNILPPYKTTVSVTANVNSALNTDTTTFIVLGMKQRIGTFTSTAPQSPRFVLRDPPGDASYASIESGYTNCVSTIRSVVNSLTQEATVTAVVGGDQIIGLGSAIEVKNEYKTNVTGGGSEVWNYSTNEENCITTTEVITTSPNDVVVGSDAGGDVYVGVAENITYGTADVVNYNPDSCKITLNKTITINDVSLSGTFVYSERHILKDVIPSLELLASQPKSINPNRDRDALAVTSWKKYVKMNRDDKSLGSIFEKIISFDAGATYEEAITTDSTTGWTEQFDGGGFYGGGFDAALNTGFGGVEGSLVIKHEHIKSNTTDKQSTKSKTITYHFEDDDTGDNFLVKVYKGLIWNSYKFELLSGESSCPWEKGTRQRSAPFLTSVDGINKVNVPANTPAVFQLSLGNTSPTEEEMNYDLSMETGTNPDGAIVKVDGQPLTQPISYRIPYGETRKVVVTIDKGPLTYNYSDIVIQLESGCETELADARGGDPLVDEYFVKTLKLSTSFIEPCSPVDIGFPLQGFVVTPAFQNKLSVTLNEYNKNDADLKLIRLQYRPIGGDGSWINISETPKADLGDVFTLKEWNTSLNKDGEYEIRAVAECTNPNLAPGISTVVKGSIERNPPELVGVPEPGDGTWDPGDEISITFNEPIDCDKVVQADIQSKNTIGLYDATTNALVDAKISCVGNKLIIVPNINPVFFENRVFRVEVSGKDYDDGETVKNPNHQAAAIRDKAGNMIPKTIKWEFAVNQNNLEWVGTDVIETNEVLKTFSVKRQIRNRGGSIASFRMERPEVKSNGTVIERGISIPSWLTVSPATGTLNPGQVADVTLTFQQDLLIGDYLDTLGLIGSKGIEPLIIDYRVRCPQPKYEVTNPEQYESTMNMVVDLSIFGVHSKDPSDVVVAKIDGQIRGVGRVAYYRNLPADKQRWLTFLTIYGNADDQDKPIEFHIWDGDKCNEYVEVLEKITYAQNELVGSPLVPQSIQVLNLVKKCIPLNKGWSWVSFNLDLGTGNNTVTNVLSSLKNKDGVIIKDEMLFSKYYASLNAWKHTLKEISPTTRYLIQTTEKDTICIKGAPYTSSMYPIKISVGWNWIGYVPSAGMTVTQALKGLIPLNGDLIKSQTLFAQYVAGVGWIGNLNFLEPMKGYFLKMSNAGTLTYPSTSNMNFGEGGGLASETALVAQAAQSTTSDNFTQYQTTMNMVARVTGIDVVAEDELRAYIGEKLVGVNKSLLYEKSRLFFQTIYSQDELNVKFKLYKADRKKEYELNKTLAFKADAVVGLVTNPMILSLVTTTRPVVTVIIPDHVIEQPTTVFPVVSIANGISETNSACTTFAFNSVLPTGTDTKVICNAQSGLEGNMNGVTQLKYNERTITASANDVLSFVNPITNQVVGCGTFDNTSKFFDYTIGGNVASTETPINVHYYSDELKKIFTLKSGIMYKNNKFLGDYNTPNVLDFAPISVSANASGVVTAVMRDTSWTGKYCVEVFAMNCSNYDDGKTSFCFQRLKRGDCVELIVRKVTESVDKTVQALSISSESMIQSGIKINYKGGNVVDLKPGFDVNNGAIFTGNIEGCNNRRTNTISPLPAK